VFPQLEQLGLHPTIFVCTSYAGAGSPLSIPELEGDDPAELATMTWDDLRAHADRGAAIGSHGVSHAHLIGLADEELGRELRDSKAEIEEELGRPCTEFAYPYGEHDERVRTVACRAGYERAFGLHESGHDPYASPRLDLYRRHRPWRAFLLATPVRRFGA
jgi:peptidoglycan/xylan/chitin deacetylase (PgdA/CDA1 family)